MSEQVDFTLFDAILDKIGHFGKYQVIQVLLTGICAIPVGTYNLANVFLAAVPEYWCEDTHSLRNGNHTANETVIDTLIKYESSGNHSDLLESNNAADECHISHNSNVSNAGSLDLKPCESWKFDRSVYHSTAATEWSLVCSSQWLASLSQTTYMLGFLVGAFCLGAISDRYGRKMALVTSLLLMIVSGTLTAFVPEYWLFIAVRMVCGLSAAGEYQAGFVITMEIIGKDKRMRNGIFYQAWFAVGYMLMSLAAYWLRNFRHLALLLGLCPILVIPSFPFIDESPRWLLSQKKMKKASVVIKRACKLNKAQFPEDLLNETELLKQNESTTNEDRKNTTDSGNILDLFRTPNMRRKSLIICYLWFVVCLVYYGLSFGTRDLLGGPHFNLFLSGLTEFPSYVVTVLVLDRIGRRWPMSISLLVSGICCLCMALLPGDFAICLTILSMSGKFFISGGFAIVYVYSAELFPTVVRAIGVGTGSIFAMVAGILAPFIALLDDVWRPLPYLIFGGITVLGGILTLMLPETLATCLPDTIEEAENFARVQCGRWCDRTLEDSKPRHDVNENEAATEKMEQLQQL